METIPKFNFFNAERMMEFWGYVKWAIEVAMPMIMLFAAASVVGWIIIAVRDAMDETKKDDDHDDNDYEIRRY